MGKKKGKAKRPNDGNISPASSEEERQEAISELIQFLIPASSSPAIEDALYFANQHLSSLLFKHGRLLTAMQFKKLIDSTDWATIRQPIEFVKNLIADSSKSSVVEDRSLQLHQVLRDLFPQLWARIEPLLPAAEPQLALASVDAISNSALAISTPTLVAAISSDDVAALKEIIQEQADL